MSLWRILASFELAMVLGGCNAVLGLEESSLAGAGTGGPNAGFALATGQGSPKGITIDRTSVYWTNWDGGTVMKVPIAGGTPIALASGQRFPERIAVYGTSVFWTASDSYDVMREPVEGGALEMLAPDEFGVDGLAVDAMNVYWAARAKGASDTYMVKKLPHGAVEPIEITAGDAPVVVGGTSVYYLGDEGLMKVPLEGGSPVLLTPLSAEPIAMALDQDHVYWTSSDGTVSKVSVDGGTPTTLAFGQGSSYGIAVDATSVYWTTGSAVMKVALEGGEPRQLAEADSGFGIAVDASYVYWTNSRSSRLGSVMKASK